MDDQTNVMISAQGVHKTFRTGTVEVHALRGVSLEVARGEMVAVMGPSGCGKTTLLNCLSGLDDFDEGEVIVEGKNLRSMNDRARTSYRAQRMGFVFQTFNLLPVLTALENVELPLLVAGVRTNDARKRALRALDDVGLSDRVQHRPSELSGGQRQRVTIARALVNNPAIVWADEPTGNLDSKSSGDVLALMRALNQERQQTFIIVTHDIEIGRSCDRILNMADGEIVSDTLADAGAPAQTSAEIIEEHSFARPVALSLAGATPEPPAAVAAEPPAAADTSATLNPAAGLSSAVIPGTAVVATPAADASDDGEMTSEDITGEVY